jgi:hypothetical protein
MKDANDDRITMEQQRPKSRPAVPPKKRIPDAKAIALKQRLGIMKQSR